MSTKLVKNVNDQVWRRFAGHCKAKGIFIGKELSKVLKKYLEGVKK